jgi:hypothetical protein
VQSGDVKNETVQRNGSHLNELHVAQARVKAQPVIDACAEAFGVQRDSLTAEGRKGFVVLARRLAMSHLAASCSAEVVSAVFRRTVGAVNYALREHAEGILHDTFYRSRAAMAFKILSPAGGASRITSPASASAGNQYGCEKKRGPAKKLRPRPSSSTKKGAK